MDQVSKLDKELQSNNLVKIVVKEFNIEKKSDIEDNSDDEIENNSDDEVADNSEVDSKICQFIDLDEPLVTTRNNLSDIIKWLKMGAYVVVHSRNGRFFHKCNKRNLTTEEIKQYIDTHRFIYIDVSKMPGLLDDGEWNWYITHAGFDECKCYIKEIALDRNIVPHKTMLHL
jgi:hypothetical protein